MVIPKLQQDGTLPVGIHPATLKEVVRMFGLGSPRRAELKVALDGFIDRARKAGIQKVLIDGSFVTRKREPRDVDVAVFVDEEYAIRLGKGDPHALWIKQKAEEDPPRLIDVLVAVDAEEWDSWGRFYMRDPWFANKGLLEVRL